MTEETKTDTPIDTPQEDSSTPVQQDLVLTITMKPDMSISVSGPLVNKFICYGMLKSAEKVIDNFQAGPPLIVTPGQGAAQHPFMRQPAPAGKPGLHIVRPIKP